MKRSSFLGALLALIATPFLSFGKKKEEPKEWHVRESADITGMTELQIKSVERDMYYRMLEGIKPQIKSWVTGSIHPKWGNQIHKHLHVVIKLKE